ncbi:MAG TPA: hypothetical protein VIP98_00030 [Microlunatus sp.]
MPGAERKIIRTDAEVAEAAARIAATITVTPEQKAHLRAILMPYRQTGRKSFELGRRVVYRTSDVYACIADEAASGSTREGAG